MQTFTPAMKFTSCFIAVALMTSFAHAQWSVDFSRRSEQMGKKEVPVAEQAPTKEAEKGIFDKIFQTTLPTQEIVILNTDQGFTPSTVRVREGSQYKIIIVNVNEKAKNVSFVLDSFSEHHATFYGKLKEFLISPKKEGVYTFVSPETSAQGRLIVHPAMGGKDNSPTLDIRAPASLTGE
jgi:hypothetical protein